MERLIEHVDFVAMDMKLPSATGEPARFDDHGAFLAIAKRRDHFVKMVVGPETPVEEVLEACAVVAAVNPASTVVLQPATPFGRIKRAPAAGLMLDLQRAAAGLLDDVRVIPQTHVYMGQL